MSVVFEQPPYLAKRTRKGFVPYHTKSIKVDLLKKGDSKYIRFITVIWKMDGKVVRYPLPQLFKSIGSRKLNAAYTRNEYISDEVVDAIRSHLGKKFDMGTSWPYTDRYTEDDLKSFYDQLPIAPSDIQSHMSLYDTLIVVREQCEGELRTRCQTLAEQLLKKLYIKLSIPFDEAAIVADTH